jgi:hypothetical protein
MLMAVNTEATRGTFASWSSLAKASMCAALCFGLPDGARAGS